MDLECNYSERWIENVGSNGNKNCCVGMSFPPAKFLDSLFLNHNIYKRTRDSSFGTVENAGRQVPIFSYFSRHTPIFPIF